MALLAWFTFSSSGTTFKRVSSNLVEDRIKREGVCHRMAILLLDAFTVRLERPLPEDSLIRLVHGQHRVHRKSPRRLRDVCFFVKLCGVELEEDGPGGI